MTTKDQDMSEQSNELSQAFIDEVAQNIAELPDRNSPEEYPDCMLVTYDELNEVMHAVHEDVPAVDCAPLLARIAELEAELREAKEDTKRLDYMLLKDAFAVPSKTDSGAIVWQLWNQDEDEEYFVLSGETSFFKTPREAIDAAIRGNE